MVRAQKSLLSHGAIGIGRVCPAGVAAGRRAPVTPAAVGQQAVGIVDLGSADQVVDVGLKT